MVDRTQNIIRNISSDRIIKLKPREGDKTLNTSGMVDNRLFSGKNTLHVIMDKQTAMWYPKYDSGILPQPLQQRFTSYQKAINFITQYFNNRNIDVEEVLDA